MSYLDQLVADSSAYFVVPGVDPNPGVRWHFRSIEPDLLYKVQYNETIGLANKQADTVVSKAEDEEEAALLQQARQLLRMGEAGQDRQIKLQRGVVKAGCVGVSLTSEVCPLRVSDEKHRCGIACFPKTFEHVEIVDKRDDADRPKGQVYIGHVPGDVQQRLFEGIMMITTEAGRLVDRLLAFRGEWDPIAIAHAVRGLRAEAVDVHPEPIPNGSDGGGPDLPPSGAPSGVEAQGAVPGSAGAVTAAALAL